MRLTAKPFFPFSRPPSLFPYEVSFLQTSRDASGGYPFGR